MPRDRERARRKLRQLDHARCLVTFVDRQSWHERNPDSRGDEARWSRARRVIVDAIDRDGTFLDVGCANGLLMESLSSWAAERGHTIEPYGLVDHRGVWYVIAKDDERGRELPFRVDRIREVTLTDREYLVPDDFTTARYRREENASARIPVR